MQKITDKLPIETWKEIAYHVQRLNFSNGGEEEFKKNLQKLKKLLVNLDLELIEGSREPSKEEEIGLSTLIQSIYDIFPHETGEYNKSGFYEQIYTLVDLGVQEIEFCPINFYNGIMEMKQIYYKRNNKTVYDKAYTDGIFELQKFSRIRKNDNGYLYNIVDLCDATYILNISLHKNHHPKATEPIKLKQASASLKNFSGEFPSKKEIMMDRFPVLVVPKQEIGFGEDVHDLQEDFELFNIGELSCSKRLTRDKNGIYYYKREPKNEKN